MNIQVLRKIVNNGWTIATRRNIVAKIGKSNAKEISELSSRANLGMDIFTTSQAQNQVCTESKSILTALQKRFGLIERDTKVVTEQKNNGISSFLEHYDEGGTLSMGYLPDDYVTKKVIHVEAEPAHTSRFLGRTRVFPATEAHDEVELIRKPHYYIDYIYSSKKGYGTRAIQAEVENSLQDVRTQGRVMLECAKEDANRPCPAGFYYKLGFRFTNPYYNEICEQWLKSGGLRENAPNELFGKMYLPKENIIHCLTYGMK